MVTPKPQLALSSADKLDLRTIWRLAADVEEQALLHNDEQQAPDLTLIQERLADAAALVRRIRRRHDKRAEARKRRGSPLEG